ncbi:hypothetical protein KCP75_21300 [Salmonella enterica subsp. enterica]|nr:hypothetical protein KCP75_21300 [Salmonella enterica subsp. enterica]
MGAEAKLLHPENETALTRPAWPARASVRGNTCRWLTVAAARTGGAYPDFTKVNYLKLRALDSPSLPAAGYWLHYWRNGRTAPAIRSSKPAFWKRSQNWKRTLLTTVALAPPYAGS